MWRQECFSNYKLSMKRSLEMRLRVWSEFRAKHLSICQLDYERRRTAVTIPRKISICCANWSVRHCEYKPMCPAAQTSIYTWIWFQTVNLNMCTVVIGVDSAIIVQKLHNAFTMSECFFVRFSFFFPLSPNYEYANSFKLAAVVVFGRRIFFFYFFCSFPTFFLCVWLMFTFVLFTHLCQVDQIAFMKFVFIGRLCMRFAENLISVWNF